MRVDEESIAAQLYTAASPDPDLLIRTSGEMRISNFLLWQIAYSELYVTETLWPDFNPTELLKAILEYQKRDRRYGGLSREGLNGARADREENLIEDRQSYRLPTDREWSTAVGLANESGVTPQARDGKIKNEFPWGKQWPPPASAFFRAGSSRDRIWSPFPLG